MLHRLAVCLAALLSLCLAGSVFAQERVTLKQDFKAGQDLLYPMAMRMTIDQTVDEQEVKQWILVCSATLVLRIESVESDGSIKAQGSFKRGALRLTDGDLIAGYAWGADARNDPTWGEATALAAPLQQAKFKISVDPRGQATVTEGLDAFVTRYLEIGGGDERLLGFFSPEKLGEAITPIFAMDDVSREPITAGKEWQTTELIPLADAGDLRLAVDFILQRVEPHEVEYLGNPRLTFSPATDAGADAPTVTLVGGGGGVSGIFDLNARKLRQRKQTTQIKTQWRSKDVTLIQTQNSIMYLQLGEEKR